MTFSSTKNDIYNAALLYTHSTLYTRNCDKQTVTVIKTLKETGTQKIPTKNVLLKMRKLNRRKNYADSLDLLPPIEKNNSD